MARDDRWGVTNIAEVKVPLEALTALVAPNNYGKSSPTTNTRVSTVYRPHHPSVFHAARMCMASKHQAQVREVAVENPL